MQTWFNNVHGDIYQLRCGLAQLRSLLQLWDTPATRTFLLRSASEVVDGDARGPYFARLYIVMGTAGVFEPIPSCPTPRMIWRIFCTLSRHIIRRYYDRESYCEMCFNLVRLLDRVCVGGCVQPDPRFWTGFPAVLDSDSDEN